ncbi:MAG: hypothetical protein KKH04_06610 [Proteobacteria bacterium]|nr:hypothetical protein [Pseudomonadota bacterium]
MAVLIFLVGFFLFFGSDSFAQVYKYVNKEGKVCFTDNLMSSLLKDGTSNKEQKSKGVINQRKRNESGIKDIMQLGQEILEEELAKPPRKQNRRLIREMTEILYGEGPSKNPRKASFPNQLSYPSPPGNTQQ